MNRVEFLKAYDYLYYKFYKMSEAAPSRWWSDWKAVLAVSFIGIYSLISVIGYVSVILNQPVPDEWSWFVWSSGAGIIVFNYYRYLYKEKWRDVVDRFEQLNARKKKYGSVLFVLFLVLFFANIIVLFYVMSITDW